jgi:type IV pilus assembly protein PilV
MDAQAIMDTGTARGFTMIEVLVSIVILSLGLLGIAGLQAFALKNSHSASLRLTATTLATDVMDRMRSNYQAVSNGEYNKPDVSAYATAVSSCQSSSGCTSQERAQHDLYEWAQRVAAGLPNGIGIVCLDSTPNDGASSAAPACDNTGTSLYVVKIWWTDDRSRTASATPQLFTTAFNP